MKTKIKRHSRSVISVLLAVCMLVSCMTVGIIATDAAQVTNGGTVGANVDSDRVGSQNFYLKWAGNDWGGTNNTNTQLTGTDGTNGHYYSEVATEVGDFYFRLYSNNDYSPSIDGTDLGNGAQGGYNGGNAWKYTTDVPTIRVFIDQSGENREWNPWVWIYKVNMVVSGTADLVGSDAWSDSAHVMTGEGDHYTITFSDVAYSSSSNLMFAVQEKNSNWGSKVGRYHNGITPTGCTLESGSDNNVVIKPSYGYGDYDITITCNNTNGEIQSVKAVPKTQYYIVSGDSSLTGNSWDVDDPDGLMTFSSGTTYTKTFNRVSAGTYQFRISQGAEDSNYLTAAALSISGTAKPTTNGSNVSFTLSTEKSVTITSTVNDFIITRRAPTAYIGSIPCDRIADINSYRI